MMITTTNLTPDDRDAKRTTRNIKQTGTWTYLLVSQAVEQHLFVHAVACVDDCVWLLEGELHQTGGHLLEVRLKQQHNNHLSVSILFYCSGCTTETTAQQSHL